MWSVEEELRRVRGDATATAKSHADAEAEVSRLRDIENALRCEIDLVRSKGQHHEQALSQARKNERLAEQVSSAIPSVACAAGVTCTYTLMSVLMSIPQVAGEKLRAEMGPMMEERSNLETKVGRK
jgi:hypothetical protein